MSALLHAGRAVDFDRLYRRHAASVYRYAFAVLGNHSDAEDVTQQTFLNAYRAMAQGTKPRKAENWLLRIAHNEVRRHFRRTQQKAFEVELDEDLPDRLVERSEPTLPDVLRALQHLPPAHREALVMREFEGRSFREIAQMMNVSQSALEAQVFRARRALAEHLEGALTCTEAEDALLRRLDTRLPRRVARRLKAHLSDCPGCVHFADVQKRQRALLKGLSVMPIPASIFLFRGEQAAAAGVGASAVTAGGSAAVGGGTAATAGAGAAGIATGVVAKTAAATAAAALAGGVGYGVAAGPDAVVRADRKVDHAAAAERTNQPRRTAVVHRTRAARAELEGARPTVVRAPRKTKAAKARAGVAASRANALAGADKARGALGRTHAKAPSIHRDHPQARSGVTPEARPSRDRSRPAKAKKPHVATAPRKPARPPRNLERPKPPPDAKLPPPPKAAVEAKTEQGTKARL
jgi:RNA polymerase sigma-70 factor, ECF subfamily